MTPTLPGIVAFAVVLVLAPAVAGVATRTKSFLTGRRGFPVVQPYRDIWKLLRRGAVYSETTTWVFRLAPVAVVATAVVAAVLVPLDGRASLVRFTGDVVAFAYALALGRFVLVIAALDTGSSFEGMGASREAAFSTLVEAGVFLSLAALSLLTDDLSLTGMLGAPLAAAWGAAAPALVMVGGSLFAMMLAECSRVPVDDPATHLELTMVHEVMILDHSGPDLALLVYSGALKLTLFGALLVGVLIPRQALGAGASIAVLAAGLLTVGVAVGVVESLMARVKMPKVPLYLAGGSALALFGLVLLLR